MKIITYFKSFVVSAVILVGLSMNAQSPVEKYGQLKVSGNKIVDKNGNAVQLRGMSLFWSNTDEGDDYYNATTINWLSNDWCVDVIRVAMGVEAFGGSAGYLNNPAQEMAKVKTVIDACIAKGLYVIVDFHSHNAETANQKTAAKTFFKEIAQLYGDKPNVLYETFNEPIYQSWSTLKSFHNEMVSYIRQYDSDNIIICGTRSYSREVEEASLDKVTGTNIAYTMHFYAGGGNDHNGDLRQKVTNAMNNGIAIFCTEYGTCNPLGNGDYNAANTQTWWDYLDSKKIGHCNWSVSWKNETASIVNTKNLSNWTASNLTTSGSLVRNHIKSKCNTATGSISIVTPINNASFDAGVSVAFSATASVSTGGTIAKVEFTEGSTILNSDASSPYGFSTTSLSIGTHSIVAKSYDPSGILLASSEPVIVIIKGQSDVSSTGVVDMFETITPISRLTGGYKGTCATSAGIKEPATMGVYWYEDKETVTSSFLASYVRAGNNKLVYTISQALNQYEPIGFNFGEYCDGVSKKNYTIDLSSNAVLKMTVANPSTNTVASFEVSVLMRDINGKELAYDKAYKAPGVLAADIWKYQIGMSKNHTLPLAGAVLKSAVTPLNFEYDFKNAIMTLDGTVYPPTLATNTGTFDFTKVKELLITVTNSAANTTFQPLAFTNQKIEISNFTIGNYALGTSVCTTPAAPVAVSLPSICQGIPAKALSTTGTDFLELVWYGTNATGGVGSLVATQPSTVNSGTTKYYVSQRVPETTCEGPRRAIDVIVSPSSIPTVSIVSNDSDNSISFGTPVTFTATPGNGGASPTYEWVLNGTTVPGQNTKNYTSSALNNEDKIEARMIPSAGICSNPGFGESNVITIKVLTSLNTNAEAVGISLYPNPASTEVTVEGFENTFDYSISDFSGNEIKSGNSEKTINISDLSVGSYVLKIGEYTFKVVKQ